MGTETRAKHSKASDKESNSRFSDIRNKYFKYIRPIVIFAAIPVGLFLIEWPFNPLFGSMETSFLIANLIIIGVLFSIVYGLAQRSRIAVAVFLVACLVFGATNYFLGEFKGWPLMPADLYALSTAAEVSSGYSIELTDSLIQCFIVLVIYCVILFLMPRVKITLPRCIVSTSVAVVLIIGFGYWINNVDIKDAYGCTVDEWAVKESYYDHGSVLCFLKRIQDMTPSVPDDYSDELADEILAEAAASAPNSTDTGTDDEDSVKPTVITIMNETFADLSIFGGFEDSDLIPRAYYEVAADSLESGTVYVSTYGGGTCNSEFEFLTESSIGFLGGGIYPYMMFDFSNTNSLVSYFKDLGYATHAIHPESRANWRRDSVYEELGFDDFSDRDEFEDADRLRDNVTDAATYDYILNLLEDDSDPQFIFDVTMQNHGDWLTGAIDDDMLVHIELPTGDEDDALNEYASCIQQSAEDLLEFTNELNAIDTPIVLCFFGDHQPGFINDWLWGFSHDGEELADGPLEDVQMPYEIPYLIWSNTTARECGIDSAAEDIEMFYQTDDVGNDEYIDFDENVYIEESDGEVPDNPEGEIPEEDFGEILLDGQVILGEEFEEIPIYEDAQMYMVEEPEYIVDEPEIIPDEGFEEIPIYEDAQMYMVEEPEEILQNPDEEGSEAPENEFGEEGLEEGTEDIIEAEEDLVLPPQNRTSLNYLGARLVADARLPRSSYQSFTLDVSKYIPVINVNGFLTANNVWHHFDDGTASAFINDKLWKYSIVQYKSLFG